MTEAYAHLVRTVLRLKPARTLSLLAELQAGYPTSTMGGGGGPTAIVQDEDGNDVSVSLTTVEAAALVADPARKARARYLHAIERASKAVDEAAQIERFWTEKRQHFGTAECANVVCRELIPLTPAQATDAQPVRCGPCHTHWAATGRDRTRKVVLEQHRRKHAS